jgi:hypothetical protein
MKIMLKRLWFAVKMMVLLPFWLLLGIIAGPVVLFIMWAYFFLENITCKTPAPILWGRVNLDETCQCPECSRGYHGV